MSFFKFSKHPLPVYEIPEFFPDNELLNIGKLREEVSEAGSPIPLLKEARESSDAILNIRYKQEQSIEQIVRGRAWVVDEILKLAWKALNWPDPDEICLIAVGGYGRGELLPHSDVDLLVLTKSGWHKKYRDYISSFLTILWDIGLEPGHSVRSIRQCKHEASQDITVATALMESRVLIGNPDLFKAMYKVTHNERIWPVKKFVTAKLNEQSMRHRKSRGVDYALEPNVKTSPGGLRDIQTISWVCKRKFGTNSFKDLANSGFLTEQEYASLKKGQEFLWKIRYGLHMLENRSEDRLLFEKQKGLARLFGYKDDEKSLAVEKLMKLYYREVGNLSELNDVILQHLDEVIFREHEKTEISSINSRFQIRNEYIEVVNSKVFKQTPFALIEIFVLMGENPLIKGIRASTIRLILESRVLIDETFRLDSRNIELFTKLLRTQNHMSLQLSRMARYGVLGLYLPEFGRITGQMQHDLFHIYTVDAHTLQVVENMRKFRLPEAADSFPIAAHIFKNLPKVELLYIAGLYHDIAKGRGGDHSELGKTDAINFCARHKLSEWDTSLVSWLVENHLLMSMTAQRKDTNDHNVIKDFAEHMGDKLHLDYLYTMTVADICATNPELWNSWRATLLRQLYQNTRRALRLGLERTINREERISDKKETAFKLLKDKNFPIEKIQNVWELSDDEYFVRESVTNIVWHTEGIIQFEETDPLVLVQDTYTATEGEGATQVFIYTANADYLFAICTAAFEKLGLDIQEARIFTSSHDYCMDTFTVLENGGLPVGDNLPRRTEIIEILETWLRQDYESIRVPKLRQTRKEKYFAKSIEVTLITPSNQNYSILEINCPDQSGVLACVGEVLATSEIHIKDARITTLGERVEDLFFITDKQGQPIVGKDNSDKLCAEIKYQLENKL